MDKVSDAPGIEKLKKYSFEIGSIRPPSEGGSHSLLIRVTRNCPWNRCTFCYGSPYAHAKFELRPVEDVKADIAAAKAIYDHLRSIEKKAGGLDWAWQMLNTDLLYDKSDMFELSESELRNFHSVHNVFEWMNSGAKTAFLQDANSLIMKTPELVEVIHYLKETFPSLERITSYARAKTIAKKSVDELKELRKAGLSRLHIGLETGDDELLGYINKGVTAEEEIEGGKKAMAAGFEVSVYIMPGLGGKKFSQQHAKNTAAVLNGINPTYIRSRRFVPRAKTPLYDEWKSGNFQLLSPHELLGEIKLFVEELNVHSNLCFDHFINPAYKVRGDARPPVIYDGTFAFRLRQTTDSVIIVPLFSQSYEGYRMPDEKKRVLELIENGLKINEAQWVRTEDMVGLNL
jgi:radical SAM superfamily enzyme YgiQ (UPF0313 family)